SSWCRSWEFHKGSGSWPGSASRGRRHFRPIPRRCSRVMSDRRILDRPWGGSAKETAMLAQKITPCLWFDGQAEEAANFYVGLLPDSRVDHVQRSPADYPSGKAGDVIA